MNISSIVVQAPSKYIDELVELFKESDYCDYHLHDKATGKIIVTVEGEGVEEEIKKFLSGFPLIKEIDYVAVVEPDTLQPAREIKGGERILVAVRMPSARLIDNWEIKLKGDRP